MKKGAERVRRRWAALRLSLTSLTLDPSLPLTRTSDLYNNRIRKINPTLAVTSLCGSGAPGSSDGTGAAALFSGPTALALSGSTLFVADTGNGRVRAVTGLTTSNGIVTTLAASASSGLAVRGVAVDLVGNVFFSAGNTVRRISAGRGG